jgi:hypothetical protein
MTRFYTVTADTLAGEYGAGRTVGILSEHAEHAERLGFVLRHARNGATWVAPADGGRAVRLVCSEIVMLADAENEPETGRCGAPTVDGAFCVYHAAVVASWRAGDE